MKKIILSIATCSTLLTSAFAQSTTADNILKKYRFSIFAGLGINHLHPANATATASNGVYNLSNTGGRTGFLFGISADWNLNERYSAYTGIGLDWRGGQVTATHDATALEANYLQSATPFYKQQYVTIPLGLKLKAAEVSGVKIYAQTGIDLGILISQKGNYTAVLDKLGNTATLANGSKLNGYATSNPIDIGWSIGVGGEYRLNTNNSFYATLLYRNGILDHTLPSLNKDGYKFNDGNIRSNTFSLRVGYYF